MLSESSIVPERGNLRYYLVSVEWFNRWKLYCCSQDSNPVHPGQINQRNDIKQLIFTNNLIQLGTLDYFYNSLHLKDTAKEDVHYKVFDEQLW